MERIGIYGAGSNGISLLKTLQEGQVSFFVDQDEQKTGMTPYGKEILPLQEGLVRAQKEKIRLVVSVEDKKVCELLQKEFPAVSWSHFSDYLQEGEIAQRRRGKVWNDYAYDFSLRDNVFLRQDVTGFRQEFYDDFNRALCEAMEYRPAQVAALFRDSEEERAKEALASPMSVPDAEGLYPDERYENRFSMQLIRSLLRGQRGKVLEIGCGHGELLQRLKTDGMEVYGTDLDEERIRFLTGKGVCCYLCDAAKAPVPEHSMDVVICSELLEHVPDPMPVIMEMRRVLKKNGRVYCSVPYMKHCDCHEHVRFFSESDFWTLFRRAGFGIDGKGDNMIRIPYVHMAFAVSIFLGASLQTSEQ